MAGYKKLLVLLDLSEDSEQVAIAGRDLAAYSHASMVALHVVEFVPVEPLGESLMPPVQIEDELINRARARGLTNSSRAWDSPMPRVEWKPATPSRKFSALPNRRRWISSSSAAVSAMVWPSW